MSDLYIVSADLADKVISWDLAIESVSNALASIANDDAILFPVQVMHGINESDVFAVKAGVEKLQGLVGFKFGGFWPGNINSGLPAHSSTTVLLDAATGFPRALISGKHVNLYRTAAADAVAAECLARKDASILGVIGAGHQAEYEIRAIAHVRDLSLVKISTRSESRGEWITGQLSDLDLEIQLTTAEDAVRDSDIVATVTPSTVPIVKSEWVADGTHISAMGADIRGKQELCDDLVRRSRLFADHVLQSIQIGEFQHTFGHDETLAAESISPIGLLAGGKKTGRTSDSEVTIFDSSGIAIQDLALATAILEEAIRQDLVSAINF